MAQQFIKVISVADYGKGKKVIADPGSLVNYKIDRQENCPWILYYAEWFDPWLMGDSYEKPYGIKQVIKLKKISDNILSVRPNDEFRTALKSSLGKPFPTKENYWYNWHLVQASDAFVRLFPKRKIFVLRILIAASLGDNEIKEILL